METFLLALSLGVTSGLSPGPLLTLVISSALERGVAAGVRVAVAPLLTDLPIIVLTLFVTTRLPAIWLEMLGSAGGVVVMYLGIRTWRRAATGSLQLGQTGGAGDMWRGVAVNVLNPHAWVFWMVVGGPIVARAWAQQPLEGVLFVVTFTCCLVGSKIVIASVVGRSRGRLDDRRYQQALKACAILLVVLGAWLLWQHVAMALD